MNNIFAIKTKGLTWPFYSYTIRSALKNEIKVPNNLLLFTHNNSLFDPSKIHIEICGKNSINKVFYIYARLST